MQRSISHQEIKRRLLTDSQRAVSMTQNGAKRSKEAEFFLPDIHGRRAQQKPCRSILISCVIDFLHRGQVHALTTMRFKDRNRTKAFDPSTRCCRRDLGRKVSCPEFDLRTDTNCNHKRSSTRLSTVYTRPKESSAI